MEMPDIVLIGGGGHCRVLIDALQRALPDASLAIVDAAADRVGQYMLDVPIIGDDSALSELVKAGTRGFVVAMGGARGAIDNGPRRALFEHALGLGMEPVTVVHPSAIVSKWAKIGQGCQILPGAIVNPGAQLGTHVIVNSGAIVEHDCVVGDHAHVATGARLASTVEVGERAHIGAGAVVRQLVSIGRGAIVGAGAVVVKNVSDGTVVVGIPAKELVK